MQLTHRIEFDRIATIQYKGKNLPVGKIIMFHQLQDGSIDIVVDFYPDLPQELIDALIKNPHQIGIQSKQKKV